MPGRPNVEAFFDARTSSVQYVVHCSTTLACAIIDPVLDFEEKSGSIATTNADAILAFIDRAGLKPAWILDTHPHADHLSAASYLKSKTGAATGIGRMVAEVQKIWRDIYNWPELACDGSQWDRLFDDADIFQVGDLDVRVMYSPGHTLASVTYVAGDAAFINDTLFMPDSGTARADFPGASPECLWSSIGNILSLSDDTRLFTGHDYQPGGRGPLWESTVAEQRRMNIHIAGKRREEFIALRRNRDAMLPMPKLILQALQVNIRAGQLPEPEPNGRRYLKVPIGAFATVSWN